MDIHNIEQAPAFTTKDGSIIRELLAHRNSGIQHQSLAEARVPPGATTTPHYHAQDRRNLLPSFRHREHDYRGRNTVRSDQVTRSPFHRARYIPSPIPARKC